MGAASCFVAIAALSLLVGSVILKVYAEVHAPVGFAGQIPLVVSGQGTLTRSGRRNTCFFVDRIQTARRSVQPTTRGCDTLRARCLR